jgi:hypothetical protein
MLIQVSLLSTVPYWKTEKSREMSEGLVFISSIALTAGLPYWVRGCTNSKLGCIFSKLLRLTIIKLRGGILPLRAG